MQEQIDLMAAQKCAPHCSLTKNESDLKEYLKSVDMPFEFRDDNEWLIKVAQWQEAKKALEEAQDAEKEIRNDLILMAQGKDCSGGGIKLSKHYRKGNVDYGMIPELFTVDLEHYRKEGSEYWKIT